MKPKCVYCMTSEAKVGNIGSAFDNNFKNWVRIYFKRCILSYKCLQKIVFLKTFNQVDKYQRSFEVIRANLLILFMIQNVIGPNIFFTQKNLKKNRNIARCIGNSICLVARKLELHCTSQILNE